MHRYTQFLTTIVFSAFAVTANAQSAPDRASADSLFHQGLGLMQEHRYSEACPKFEASQRVDPSFGALMNLGECYAKLGRTASAWGAYREASDLARKYSESNRVHLAESRAAAMEPKLARLVLVVDAVGDIRQVEVLRGGERIDPSVLGTPLPIDPGEYEIVARGPGYSEWRSRVSIQEAGRQVTERIILHRDKNTEASDAPTSTGSGSENPGAAFPSSATTVERSATTQDIEAGLFLSVGSGIGYASAASSDVDASVSGLTMGVGLYPGLRIGDRFVLVGAVDVRKMESPTLTLQGRSYSGNLSASQLSFGAGAGYRVTPVLTVEGLLRVSKVAMSDATGSLASSFGPGAEVDIDWTCGHWGRWSAGIRGGFSLDSLDINGTTWISKSVGVSIVGTFQ